MSTACWLDDFTAETNATAEIYERDWDEFWEPVSDAATEEATAPR